MTFSSNYLDSDVLTADVDEGLRRAMDAYGGLWRPMASCGGLWVANGKLWVAMEAYGGLWRHMEGYGELEHKPTLRVKTETACMLY